MAQGTMGEVPYIIAGGGIAGLATALALAPAPVLVLERVAAFEEVGAGLQLGPNAIRALQKLGAWDAVEPFTSAPPEIHIWDGTSGQRLKRIRLKGSFERRFGAPYRLVLRADLHGALLSLAQDVSSISLRTGSEVTAMRNVGASVEALTAKGSGVRAKLLLACDGVNSTLRRQAFPDSAAADSGLTLHRVLLDRWTAAPGVAWDCINLWLCPGAHVVHYPVGNAARLNVVATTVNGLTPAAAYTRSVPALHRLLAGVPDWLPWPSLYVPPLASWRHGKLLLLGDAAHGTLPFLAQGAAMALEDAACLKVQGPSPAFPTDPVLEERRRRTARLHAATIRIVRDYHASGARRLLRNLLLRAVPPSLFTTKLGWIYDVK